MSTKSSVFFEGLKGKQIAFIGLGRTHQDLVMQFRQKGFRVRVYDVRTREELGEITDQCEAHGIELVLGPKYLIKLGSEDIVFRTPTLDYYTPELQLAHRAGQVITSEIEVFTELCPCRIIGVTGSDKKKLTTLLIADMLKRTGATVHIGGTVGDVLLTKIDTINATDYAVVALDAPQLVSMRHSPDVGVITDIDLSQRPKYLTEKQYLRAKSNIFAHQGGFSTTVLNADNPMTKELTEYVRGIPTLFSMQAVVQRGAWLDMNGTLWYSDNDSQTKLLTADELSPSCKSSITSTLAAFSALWGTVPKDRLVEAAKNFDIGSYSYSLKQE